MSVMGSGDYESRWRNTLRHKAAGLTHHKYRKYLSHEPAKTEAFPSDWFGARWPTVGIFVESEGIRNVRIWRLNFEWQNYLRLTLVDVLITEHSFGDNLSSHRSCRTISILLESMPNWMDPYMSSNHYKSLSGIRKNTRFSTSTAWFSFQRLENYGRTESMQGSCVLCVSRKGSAGKRFFFIFGVSWHNTPYHITR